VFGILWRLRATSTPRLAVRRLLRDRGNRAFIIEFFRAKDDRFSWAPFRTEYAQVIALGIARRGVAIHDGAKRNGPRSARSSTAVLLRRRPGVFARNAASIARNRALSASFLDRSCTSRASTTLGNGVSPVIVGRVTERFGQKVLG